LGALSSFFGNTACPIIGGSAVDEKLGVRARKREERMRRARKREERMRRTV
jgi:hypothetical protein